MITHFIQRFGGAALIISGALLGYSYISHPHHMTPEVLASDLWFLIHALFALSLGVGLLATTAVYAVTAERAGWLGLAGFCLLFCGMLLIFGLNYYEVFIAPFLAEHYPQVIRDHGAGDKMGMIAVAFPLAGALTVLGYAALGAAWWRANAAPALVCGVLIAASIAFGFGLSPLGDLTAARVTAAAR